jgi:uncharacterized membrane protein YsdA (DUF1294 family)/cold shock CspA family protein
MRHQGKITSWKDDQGFGFITPNGGGNQVFVHIRSFSNRRGRPNGNGIVTYDLGTNAKGRAQAERVKFINARATSSRSSGHGNFTLLLAAAFLIAIAGAFAVGKLPIAILAFYLITSIIAFLAYALDKSAAKNDRRRTCENTLHFFALAGGWPGALAAQRLLRHKSRKQSFQIIFWTTVVLNCGALGWLFLSSGAVAIRAILGMA